MTLPCSARQVSQAPRSPSPAKRSDGRVIVRGFEGVPTAYKTGNAPSRLDHMAREGVPAVLLIGLSRPPYAALWRGTLCLDQVAGGCHGNPGRVQGVLSRADCALQNSPLHQICRGVSNDRDRQDPEICHAPADDGRTQPARGQDGNGTSNPHTLAGRVMPSLACPTFPYGWASRPRKYGRTTSVPVARRLTKSWRICVL